MSIHTLATTIGSSWHFVSKMAPKLKILYREVGRGSNLTSKQVSQCLKALQAAVAKEMVQGRSVHIPLLAIFRMTRIRAKKEVMKMVCGKKYLISARPERQELRVKPSKALRELCHPHQ